MLSERAVKIENGLEEDLLGEWSGPPGSAVDLFRPVRRAAYAVLLDVRHHAQANSAEGTEVSEWVVRPGAAMAIREVVVVRLPPPAIISAGPANSGAAGATLPSCEALWFGEGSQDRMVRMRAFLQCMHTGNASRLLDTSHVPPPLLLYCCVLRYLLFHSK